MRYDVVLVASGKGLRAGLGFNKVFYKLKDGKSVVEHALQVFRDDPDHENIILVTNPEYFSYFQGEDVILVEGGAERKDSVYNGLQKVKSDHVLIHDGARPFLHPEALRKIKEKLESCDSVVLGRMAIDTIKLVEGDRVIRTLDRRQIFQAETPQAFRTQVIRDAYARCENIPFTDDTSLVESLGQETAIVIDEYPNPKLTGKEDFKDL